MVSCGLRVHFWHVYWCGERPLKYVFPLLFFLARCKDVMVADFLKGDFGYGAWNVQFAMTVNDWEMDEFLAFFSLLNSKVLRRRDDDEMLWLGSKNDAFSVKSMYGLLMGRSAKYFPWCQI